MIVKRISDATRVLGREQGYLGLPVLDTVVHDTVGGPETPAMLTAWEPTPDELELLSRGGSVVLQVLGRRHPPVHLAVAALGDAAHSAACGRADVLERIAALVPELDCVEPETKCRAYDLIREILR